MALQLNHLFLSVGIALRQQVLDPGESVPTDEHDWVVDRVVIPEVE